MLTFCYDDFDEMGNPFSTVFKVDTKNNISPVNLGWAGYNIPLDIKDEEMLNIRSFELKHNNHSKQLQQLMINVDIKKVDDVDCKYYYVLDVFPNEFWESEESKQPRFSTKVLNDIKKNNAKLLVLFVNEAFKHRLLSSVNNIFSSWIELYHLPKNSIVLCSSSYNIDLDNKEYITHLFVPYWENIIKYNYNPDYCKLLKLAIQLKIKRNKLFLCYNRRPHKHRQNFVYNLYKEDLLQYGLTSLGRIDAAAVKSPLVSQRFVSKLPLTFDNTDLRQNQAQNLSVNDYLNTFISIVTETFLDKTVFPSEKIYKPILMLHPFFVVSSKYYLKMLKELGYKTFGKWFDESYDEIDDYATRFDIIINEIKRLSKLTEEQKQNMLVEMLPVLTHNFRTLNKRTTSNDLQKTLEVELWK